MNKWVLLCLIVAGFNTEADSEKTVSNHANGWGVSKKEATNILKSLKNSFKRPSAKETPKNLGGTFTDFEMTSDVDVKNSHCFADEIQFSQIQKSFLNPFEKSLRSRDQKRITKFLTSKVNSPKWDGPATKKVNVGGIQSYSWNNDSNISGKKKVGRVLASYIEQFKNIEAMEMKVLLINSPRKMRDENLDMTEAILHTRVDIRGIDQEKKRRNDRGGLKIHVVKNKDSWQIKDIKRWNFETLTKDKPVFQDITKVSGLTTIPEYQRIEAIRRGGYAISIGDYNGDDIQDMFVGAYGPGKLLKGKEDGTYEVVENSGIGEETYVKTAIFSDFDNDSHQDLLLVRFVPNKVVKSNHKRSDIVLYRNNGKGKFKKIHKVEDQHMSDYAMPATVADFDQDGFLDFYVGFPGAKDFTTLGAVEKDGDLKAHGLYFNKKDFRFAAAAPVTELLQENFSLYSNAQKIFPHSAVAADFDQDGDMDILVIDDRGQLSPAYQNDGKGNFSQVADKIGLNNHGYGMSSAMGDLNNDGRIDVMMTNVNMHAFDRVRKSCEANWANDELMPIHNVQTYQGLKGGNFVNITNKDNGINFPGEGLAGVEFIDYNNDGLLDIYVANGLWSGNKKEEDLSSLFSLAVYDEKISELSLRVSGYDQHKTQSVVMNILSSFKGNIRTGKWDNKSRPQLAGFQRNRLYRNLGEGQFMEVGYLEGVDSIADGYVIAKSDIDRDGDLDLILRNGDPGSEDVNYPAVQIFRNNHKNKNSLRLKLMATKSNKDAIGAEVHVTVKGKIQTSQLIANNGTAQSEKILHFGLGKAKRADKVEVFWPSGAKQTFKNVPAGLRTLTESQSTFALIK